MATVKTIYTTGLRTTSTHIKSQAGLTTDAPEDNNGTGQSFSPTDLLATALASCMLTVIGIAARAHGFLIDGARAETTKTMNLNPRRVAKLQIELEFPPNGYSEIEKQLIQKSALNCPVYLSLHPDLIKEVNFKW